ncbi:MAG: hypothetical protein R6V04_15925 [bacterium]
MKKVLEQLELKKTVKHLRAVLADQYPFEDIIAVSTQMRKNCSNL